MSQTSLKPGASSSVARNSVVMMAGFFVTSGFLFLTDLAVIDVFGPAGHGRVTLALSVAIIGALLCDLGLASKAGVRTIAALRGEGAVVELGHTVGRLMVTLLACGLAAAVVVSAAAPLLASLLHVDAFALRQASIWLFSGAGVRACAMVFIGMERMIYVAVLGSLAEGARFGWTLVCGLLSLDERYLYLGWSATWLASMLVSIGCVAVMLGAMRVRIAWWPYHAGRALREVGRGLAYLPPMLTNQALPPLLFLLVGLSLQWMRISADDATARLSVLKLCFSLALVLRIVSQAMATSLFPVVARQSAGAGGSPSDGPTLDPALLRMLGGTVRVLALCAVGAMGLFIAIGPWGLAWWDARQGTVLYAHGLPTLLLLTAAVAIDSYRVQVDQLLMGTRHVGTVVVGELTKTALLLPMIPLGVWLVTDRADVGAAAALLMLVLVIAAWRGMASRRLLGGGGGAAAGSGLLSIILIGAVAALPGGRWLALPVALALALGLWCTAPKPRKEPDA